MKQRLSFLFLVFIAMWAGLIFRGTSLKLFPDSRLLQQKEKQFSRSITVPAKRGSILDRKGRELAVSVPSYSLFADPKIITNKNLVAKQLRKILGGSRNQYAKLIAGDQRRFVWVQRKLGPETRDQILELKEKGLGFVEEPTRVYPNNALISQVLGFIGREGHGLEGLEYKYNEVLQGEKLQQIVPRDARGRPLVGDARLLLDQDDGLDLTLTVDQDAQYFLENKLMEALDKHEAQSAVGVILSVKDAEVIAMASVPGADANQARNYALDMRKNRVISDAFEPGSTMKPFIIAAGLESGLIKPSTIIDCEGGKLKVGRRWIHEADANHRFDKLTVNEVLAYSSNVGSAKIGFKVGDKKAFQFFRKMGFGKKTKVGLPGENRGILHSPPWRKHLLSNIAFGHGLAATPLQMASAFLTIANKGIYLQPTILRSIANKLNGEEVRLPERESYRAMSESVASTLSLMLTQATSGRGTGKAARVPGYPVAGKTGTAQKVDPTKGGYMKGKYISSFAGFLPSHDPRYVVYVAVDSPENDYYGSQVAAPLFSEIGRFLMRKSGIAPIILSTADVIEEPPKGSENLKKEILAVSGNSAAELKMPDLTGMTLRMAIQKLKGHSIGLKVKGSGQVFSTSPKAGEVLTSHSKVLIQLKRENL
jgi:cell division protein FtsI (penicillin-binding protein 3)